jgi:DNA-binding MarR family transcriptional regulator
VLAPRHPDESGRGGERQGARQRPDDQHQRGEQGRDGDRDGGTGLVGMARQSRLALLGLTPQQYQLMLALKGFPGRDWATVRELAERLQLRHHSVVELVNRAQSQDLVERVADPGDGRVVRVLLTPAGERVLGRLSALHRAQLLRMRAVLTLPSWSEPPEEGHASPA